MLLRSLLLQIPTYSPGVDLLWICLPVALGLMAVYLLLPRPHSTQPLLGALCAGGALVLAGWTLIQRGTASVETVLFYAFSCIAVIAGGLLVTQRNPVRAALSFALVVLSTCGLFLLQAAPFLMAATIIIYAGAIVVTFLFVIMLAQQIGTSDADQRSREPLLSCVAGFVLLAAVLGLLQQTYGVERFDDLLARAERAAAEANADGMVQIVGDNNKFFDALRHEILRDLDFGRRLVRRRAFIDAGDAKLLGLGQAAVARKVEIWVVHALRNECKFDVGGLSGAHQGKGADRAQ